MLSYRFVCVVHLLSYSAGTASSIDSRRAGIFRCIFMLMHCSHFIGTEQKSSRVVFNAKLFVSTKVLAKKYMKNIEKMKVWNMTVRIIH